jgi:hypothetical protein
MFLCFQSDPAYLSTLDNNAFFKKAPSNIQAASKKSPGLKSVTFQDN